MQFRYYWERGLTTTPVDGKKAFVTEWSTRKITEEDADEFDKKYKFPEYGIGLICGEINNILVIDADTESPELLKLLPPTPVSKKGKRGVSCFYKYNSKIPSSSIKRKNVGPDKDNLGCAQEGFDILSDGKQTVLPPSIHPVTLKPYFWIGASITEIEIEDLPEFTYDDYAKIVEATQGDNIEQAKASVSLNGPFHEYQENRCPHGSQDRMKRLASIFVMKRTPIGEAINDLIQYDQQNHHKISYFEDKTRSDSKYDVYTNAVNFYSNILTFINRQKIKKGETPYIPIEPINEIKLIEKKETKLFYPEPTGFTKYVYDKMLSLSPTPQPSLALGASISIMATILSGRYTFMGMWPNVFTMLVAPTGYGKDAPISFARKILNHEEMADMNLMGLTYYTSAQSMILGFPEQRFRLDIVDEFSEFLGRLNKADGFARTVASEITQLWDGSKEFYGGMKAVTREETGACKNPCLNLITTCQPSVFINAASSAMFDSGFLTRFLIFTADKKPPLNIDAIKDSGKINDLISLLRTHYKNPVELKSPLAGYMKTTRGMLAPEPKSIAYSKSVAQEYDDIMIRLYNKQTNGVDALLYSRAAQQVAKLVIIKTAGDGREEATSEDLDWALQMVEAVLYNSRTLIEQANAGNEYEKLSIKIESYIRDNQPCKLKTLGDRFRSVPNRLRNDVLNDLAQRGRISIAGSPKIVAWIAES